MKKTSLIGILVILLIAAWWGMQFGQAQATTGPATLRIGVVNVAEVLTKCQENLDREKEGMEKQRQIKDELEKIAAEAEAIKQELQNALQPGTKEFTARRKEWFLKEAQLQALKEHQKEALTMDSQTWTKTLYEKLLEVIKSVSRQKGITLVMNYDESSLKGRNLQEMYNLILNRKLLYASPTLDITALVLERLDAEYEKTK